MDTSRIKKFAIEARNKLKEGVATKIALLGYDSDGNVPERMIPQQMEGGAVWKGDIMSEGWYDQWASLNKRISQIGIKDVYEEAAYTWFNRLVAICILNKNGLCEPVLSYIDGTRTPVIVDEAHQGRFPQMSEQMRTRLLELLVDDTKTTEQFALLISAWCHQNPIINACFGGIADYTELLLPNDILTEGGFIDVLNHTEFITDEDFSSPELIGWLYQFYISERKDEVFAKKGKFEADEIPAATQIFTPNWIVKYMVQNTVGRIYLDNNPSAVSVFKPKWKYLVEPSAPTPKDSIYRYRELTDLLVGDLACGSGHILNECFDILYDLYIYEGYSRREAIENIFAKNLRGIDLDTRAKQLSMFALLLKACQKDASFADAHILPHVLSMPIPIPQEQVASRLQKFFRETPPRQTLQDLMVAFELMQDADSLGSIMKFDLADSTLLAIHHALDYWHGQQLVPKDIEDILSAMELTLTLSDRYAALVMNPPYMGGGNMNETLSKYVKDNYEEGKADLFSTFMLLAIDRLADKGKYGMINMHSWMFLSSFEKLRRTLLDNYHIDSLLHLGPRTFDELSGEVVQNAAFVISKSNTSACLKGAESESVDSGRGARYEQTSSGTYFRLVDGKNCGDKERIFLEAQVNHTNNVYYSEVEQNNFENIPGFSLGYWVNNNTIDIFKNTQSLHSFSKARLGQNTGDNERFLRCWYEIALYSIGFTLPDDYNGFGYKWIPYTKGGLLRRWYGPSDTVINWENDGEEIKEYCVIRNHGKHWSRYIQSYDCFYKSGMVFPRIGTGNFCTRLICEGTIYDVNAPGCFPKSNKLYLLGYLNSKVIKYFLNILCPTLTFQVGDVSKVPCKIPEGDTPDIDALVNQNVQISKSDWDLQETSWNFDANPLVVLRNEKVTQGNLDFSFRLSDFLEEFESEWTERFMRLHQNEEELNRQFINIYGLEDELTPDVPMDEITILQQGEIGIADNQIEWHNDVLMRQLISYAVGVWMGRYRLDKPGLAIAYPNPSKEELTPYEYNGEIVEIDSDGIIPLMPSNCGFDDNALNRMASFVRQVFGAESQVMNLNYIEKCLGKKLEQYFVKDFWKNHKKMYQNRPIYWLFSSKKGAFQVIAYMHRMDAYTVERIRAKYLLPYIEHLNGKIAELEQKEALLSTSDARQLENYRKEYEECREYHDRMAVYAEKAISFDLDDGVVVNYAKFGDIVSKIK